MDPKFIVDNPDAECYLHSKLNEALADVDKEFAQSVSDGWERYNQATF
jgi:hypothetical protein